MSLFAKTLAKKLLPDDTAAFRVYKLSGGISSEIYKIEGIRKDGDLLSPLTLTIIRDPNDWWKLEKEKLIRDLFGNDSEVLLPKLINLGFDTIKKKQIGFILSQFALGRDLDAFLEKENAASKDKDDKLSDLAYDLGYRLGVLHRHKADLYGLIGYSTTSNIDWSQYILSEFDKEVKMIWELDSSLQIAQVNTNMLKKSLPTLQALVGQYQSSLIIPEPRICHGDARFANFMANTASDGNWKIVSIIDLEAMLGGDAEIDIAYIENWLHFASYKATFFAQKTLFVKGYRKANLLSNNYNQKRFIYHILRSLAYLRTIFGFNIQKFIKADPRNKRYVSQHMQIITSLVEGNYLEDIKVETLLG